MHDFFAALRGTRDAYTAWGIFTDFFQSRNVKALCAVQEAPMGSSFDSDRFVGTMGFPREFVADYRDGLYQDDPARQHALTAVAPFFLSGTREILALSDREKAFLDRFEQLGIEEWLCIPVFGPYGQNGYCGLATRHEAQMSDAEVHELHIAAQMGFLHYCKLQLSSRAAPVSLSRREREILEWVARGKSNAAIADILKISTNTVDTHLRRAFDKLDVSDRTVATVRAIGLGLIAP